MKDAFLLWIMMVVYIVLAIGGFVGFGALIIWLASLNPYLPAVFTILFIPAAGIALAATCDD